MTTEDELRDERQREAAAEELARVSSFKLVRTNVRVRRCMECGHAHAGTQCAGEDRWGKPCGCKQFRRRG